jgi:hypothetical protein
MKASRCRSHLNVNNHVTIILDVCNKLGNIDNKMDIEKNICKISLSKIDLLTF